jgi:hypothetical protein
VKSGSGSLEGVLAKFSGRIAKLPVEFQAIFFEDLTVAMSLGFVSAVVRMIGFRADSVLTSAMKPTQR